MIPVTEHAEKNKHAEDGNYVVTKQYTFICIHLVFTVCMFWLLLLNKRNTCHLGSDMVINIPLSYILNLLHHIVTSCAWHDHGHQTHTEVSSTVDRARRIPAPDMTKCPALCRNWTLVIQPSASLHQAMLFQ